MPALIESSLEESSIFNNKEEGAGYGTALTQNLAGAHDGGLDTSVWEPVRVSRHSAANQRAPQFSRDYWDV